MEQVLVQFPAASIPPATSQADRKASVDQWPALASAMHHYQQIVTDTFSQQAYDLIQAGLITASNRRKLSKKAENLGIRPFDAQLLIACAIRQWSLDHADSFKRSSMPIARKRYFHSVQVRSRIFRFASLLLVAALLDALIILTFLS